MIAATCAAMAAFHTLDFWVGRWRVTVKGIYAGTDVVTRELSSCAVMERWNDADGGKGFSLFAYDAFSGQWRQTWVTDRATSIGGIKYKTLVYVYPGGGTRFQGILPAPPSQAPILDRTTLLPVGKQTVHQIIEISSDGGQHWRTTFDALYQREGY
jgi:hypothetical protein